MNTLVFSNGTQIKEILVWAIVVIVILFLMILLVLWISKTKTEKHAKALRNSTVKFRNIFLNNTFSVAVGEVASLSKIDRDGMISAYRELYLKSSKEVKDKLIAIVSSSDAIPFYLEKAKKRNSDQRLHAYLQLNRIGLAGLKDFFFESAEKEAEKNDDGKLIAACLLSAAKLSVDENDINKLVYYINKNGKLARGLQEGLIVQAAKAVEAVHGDDALVQIFLKLMIKYEHESSIYTSIISTIGKLGLDSMAVQLANIYSKACNSTSKDASIIKISCLRAFGGLDSVSNQATQSLKSGFKDNDWKVRATSCVSAGLLHLTALNEELTELLGDKAYYVRLNAARALMQIGSRVQLEKIVASSTNKNNDNNSELDPYRKSVCHYVLNEEVNDA
ncbi:hypothetical protein B1757_09480 [Acidithiobacillus marinus]|uniref:HEAT repeat domain-containing protein n=1 Tax=Acidithiobacillus marinus TaxID=187490 RepID=A0A2I1DKU6_9PROT|nr:HEAT repeat domain-containing protein [Acidithiobacillus marinus]PKY10509.1 hypothetical protein B1757_09480 [Acidithiobacillus marinus]